MMKIYHFNPIDLTNYLCQNIKLIKTNLMLNK